MILLAGLVLGVVLVQATGGDLRRVCTLKFEMAWLAAVALLTQILIINIVPHALPHAAAAAVHSATYVAGCVVLYANRRIPWMWLVAAGGVLNLAAIGANGGVMPAAPAALRSAGIPVHSAGFTNSGGVEHVRLAWLGDVFSVPSGWPLANVFSVGDILLVVGAFLLIRAASSEPEEIERVALAPVTIS